MAYFRRFGVKEPRHPETTSDEPCYIPLTEHAWFELLARVNVYLTDINTFGDYFGAA